MLGPGQRIYPSHTLVTPVLRVVDAVGVVCALYWAELLAEPVPRQVYWLVVMTAVVAFSLIGEFCGMYRNWRGAALNQEIACGWITWAISCTVLFASAYATGYLGSIARSTLVIWCLDAPLLLALSRFALRSLQRTLRAHGMNTRRYAVVGVNKLAFQLANNIEENASLGLELHGFFDDRPEGRTPKVPETIGHRIGNLDELVAEARNGDVDMVYIAFPMRAEQRIRNVLNRLADSTVSVYLVPDFFVFELLHARWTDINGLPVVSVFEQPFLGVDGIAKRIMDLFITLVTLAILAVPMLMIALAVKLTSPGPVFFRQRRYGLNGQEIRVWKFRSMRVCEDGDRVVQATKHDSRITPIGALLRRTSLDELPQLFNVLSGTMSLVGPRPHALTHNEHYRGMIRGYMLRHKVKPGITGLAQINGCRGETDTIEKMRRRIEYDHRYIQQWSLWLDLKILFKTPLVVWSQENAY